MYLCLCLDVDECETDVCGNDSECSNSDGSYGCTCDQGYYSPLGHHHDCTGLSACMSPVFF